jgi:hypothetical protein
MDEIRSRQIARLEKLAQPYIARRRQTEDEWRQTRQGAAAHAAVLAFLIRYGNATIDEPLSSAWKRCGESSAWTECCRRFPSVRHGNLIFLPPPRPILELSELEMENYHNSPRTYSFEPHSPCVVYILGAAIRYMVIDSFPGADEKEKLDAVFASAPPWLIWFTFGDYTAKLLNLTLPDLSNVSCFERSEANFRLWYGLPSGTFERRPWPGGQDNQPLARTDLRLLRPETECMNNQLTRRERKQRAIMESHRVKCPDEWPDMAPVQLLQMSEEDRLGLIRDYEGTIATVLERQPQE